MADISSTDKTNAKKDSEKSKKEHENNNPEVSLTPDKGFNGPSSIIPNLRYNIEIHLPASKDIEVYNSIFKSLREHLLND